MKEKKKISILFFLSSVLCSVHSEYEIKYFIFGLKSRYKFQIFQLLNSINKILLFHVCIQHECLNERNDIQFQLLIHC